MDDEKLQQLIACIGSLAEIATLYFDSCIRSGTSEETAYRLTDSFINAILRMAENRNTESED